MGWVAQPAPSARFSEGTPVTSFLADRGITYPIWQAPMAGVATPRLAAAVSNAGGLGSLGLGAMDATAARAAVAALDGLTDRPIHLNVFVNEPPRQNPDTERPWLAALASEFARFGAEPPDRLTAPYRSLTQDRDMQALLVERAPAIVSFHFGLPPSDLAAALRRAGTTLLVSVTDPSEADAAVAAGMDGLIAQGIEAGGHRGIFDPAAPDRRLPTATLTRLLVRDGRLPVIAAGGIMDGAGIRAALDLGTVAAQLGTAFVGCPESAADAAYRAALFSDAAGDTVLTAAISGRPARGLPNRLTAWADRHASLTPPAYPIAYAAAKALNRAAQDAGEGGYGAHWAGQGAPMARSLPAADLINALLGEMARGATADPV